MISNSVGQSVRVPLSPSPSRRPTSLHISRPFSVTNIPGARLGRKSRRHIFWVPIQKDLWSCRSLALGGRKWPDKKISFALTHMAARPSAEFIQVLPAFKSRYERLLRTEVMLIHCCYRPLGRRCLSERLPKSTSQKSDGFGAVAEMRRPAIIYPF